MRKSVDINHSFWDRGFQLDQLRQEEPWVAILRSDPIHHKAERFVEILIVSHQELLLGNVEEKGNHANLVDDLQDLEDKQHRKRANVEPPQVQGSYRNVLAVINAAVLLSEL